MSFLHLPNEIVLLIARELDHISDLNALLRTNRYLAAFLASVLIDAVFRTRSQKYGRRLLYYLAGRGDVAGVKALLDRRIDQVINENFQPKHRSIGLLCEAVCDHEVAVVRTLMLVGLDQNALDVRDQTPLRLAASLGKAATVRALLEDPTVDVELCCPGGLKPLHAAAFAGHVEAVRVLLSDPRVDVNSRARQYDTTALHEAVYGSRADVVRVLLANEAIDPNLITSPRTSGNPMARNHPCTPLHLAVARGRQEIVGILANDSRVNISLTDSQHRTPLHLAIERGHTAIAQFLDSLSPYGVRRSGFGNRQPCKYNLRGAAFPKSR